VENDAPQLIIGVRDLGLKCGDPLVEFERPLGAPRVDGGEDLGQPLRMQQPVDQWSVTGQERPRPRQGGARAARQSKRDRQLDRKRQEQK
jgi:hypothetical protein